MPKISTGTLFKRSPKPGSPWYMQWHDHNGRRLPAKSTRTSCKATANRLLAEEVRKVAEIEAGLRPRPEVVAQAAAEQAAIEAATKERERPALEYLADFRATMEAADRCDKHVNGTIGLITTLIKGIEAKTVGDITAKQVNRFTGTLREKNRSNRTIQAHLAAGKAFTKWLVEEEILLRDPLIKIKKPDPKKGRKYRRRPLLSNEWPRLRAATINAPDRYGMTGAQRAILYSTAIQTGLRSNELRSLTRTRLELTGEHPLITCRGEDTKNGMEASQYITEELAGQLGELITGHSAGAPVFSMPVETDVAEMLRTDLNDARAAWLAESEKGSEDHAQKIASDFLCPTNHDGEHLDFHALRHTCGTWLSKLGVHPKAVQAVMRHSNISLTLDVYGHLLPGQEAEAIGRLQQIMNVSGDVSDCSASACVPSANVCEDSSTNAGRSLDRCSEGLNANLLFQTLEDIDVARHGRLFQE